MTDFEKAFSDFIDRREYDQSTNALFSMIRISFAAGWLAAGGKPPATRKIVELTTLEIEREKLLNGTSDDIETDIKP